MQNKSRVSDLCDSDLLLTNSYSLPNGGESGTTPQMAREDSEEVRLWLTNIESSLRRARMDPVAIERVVSRLRRDNRYCLFLSNPLRDDILIMVGIFRDVVALLQAREILPNLPDAPSARAEQGAAEAEDSHRVPGLDELEVGDIVVVAKTLVSELKSQKWWLPQMAAIAYVSFFIECGALCTYSVCF